MFADVFDAEAVYEAPEGLGFAFFDGLDEILGGFFSKIFEWDELGLGDEVEVGDVLAEALGDELVDDGGAEIFDIHGFAGGEVGDAAADLWGAACVGAFPGGFAGEADGLGAAGGAGCWK